MYEEDKTSSILQQEKKFIEGGYGCRATFYNYRKRLNLHKNYIAHRNKSSAKNKKGICYFCLNTDIEVHHLDVNTKHNSDDNLLDVCHSCHIKLHNIYESLKKLGLLSLN